MPEPSLATRRAELARAERAKHRNPADQERAERAKDLRRSYTAEKLADSIKRAVATWPPLTNEQRDRLALLLRGGDQVA